jgi:hypothetical protein
MSDIHPPLARNGFEAFPLPCALRRAIWIAAIVLVVVFVAKAAHFLAFEEASYGPMWPNRHWLLPHFLGGALALLAGLPQFWVELRRRVPSVHRWTGRVYVAGVCVASTAVYGMAVQPVLGRSFAVSGVVMASVWLGATAMALIAIRNHQFRIMAQTPLLTGMSSKTERYAALLWLSWTVPLFVTELIIQWPRSVRAPYANADQNSARAAVRANQ